jgi:hypothetical protein
MIFLKRTCFACPEQYDAFDGEGGPQVGYLRLRHGHFYVSFPGVGGEIIYEANPHGDGIFEDNERDYYLKFAVDAIEKRIKFGPRGEDPAPDVQYKIDDSSGWED